MSYLAICLSLRFYYIYAYWISECICARRWFNKLRRQWYIVWTYSVFVAKTTYETMRSRLQQTNLKKTENYYFMFRCDDKAEMREYK